MTTLADFLLARIAEDEAVARNVKDGPPSQFAHTGHFGLAQFDPARVLAECESKRRVVADHKIIVVWPEGTGGAKYYTGQKRVCATCADGPTADVPCRTLRFLALPYADHPDYRDEWRP